VPDNRQQADEDLGVTTVQAEPKRRRTEGARVAEPSSSSSYTAPAATLSTPATPAPLAPATAPTPLTRQMRINPDTLDGHRCPVPQCVRSRGHGHPHMDIINNIIEWDPLTSTTTLISPSATMDVEQSVLMAQISLAPALYSLEVEVDYTWWEDPTAWLSKKMQSRGGEVSWKSLSPEQRGEFDTAVAKGDLTSSHPEGCALSCGTGEDVSQAGDEDEVGPHLEES
jgi:hypothetical protein